MSDAITVMVAAASPVVRAGLKALVGAIPGCALVGASGPAELLQQALELQPATILWQLAADEDAATTLASLEGIPTVILTEQSHRNLIRAGARGVLPTDASELQIEIAIRAAGAGLAVLPHESATAPAVPQAASGLTARETQILRMVAEGLANKEIAYRLGISEHTVKFHVSALLGKLGAGSRAEAIGMGVRLGAIML
ncbi:MAG: response regulator transcription factor [Terriglobia bacterium]